MEIIGIIGAAIIGAALVGAVLIFMLYEIMLQIILTPLFWILVGAVMGILSYILLCKL